jgi:hypothetical protein
MIQVDIDGLIRELRERLACVEETLAMVETNTRASANPRERNNRGRKSMGTEERAAVSARIKRYWAGRRSAPAPPL